MGIGQIVLLGAMAFCIAILLLRLFLLRRSLWEIAQDLEEKLNTDTNTQISVSTGDRAIRALASRINFQLLELRRERLRLKAGDMELKAAVTNISHDLRTPLTSICGYLDLLEQEEHTQRAKRYLAIIRERTDAMRSLTEELFHYSIVTAALDELPKEETSMKAVLEQSIAAFYGVLSERGISPDIALPETPVLRMLNAEALRRVFDNILSNAVKYSDGDLSIALTPDGTATFSNAACRMNRVQAARLFERFYTVETASGSTGLGLSIARQITEKLGGTISAGYEHGRLCICVSFSYPKSNRERS